MIARKMPLRSTNKGVRLTAIFWIHKKSKSGVPNDLPALFPFLAVKRDIVPRVRAVTPFKDALKRANTNPLLDFTGEPFQKATQIRPIKYYNMLYNSRLCGFLLVIWRRFVFILQIFVRIHFAFRNFYSLQNYSKYTITPIIKL